MASYVHATKLTRAVFRSQCQETLGRGAYELLLLLAATEVALAVCTIVRAHAAASRWTGRVRRPSIRAPRGIPVARPALGHRARSADRPVRSPSRIARHRRLRVYHAVRLCYTGVQTRMGTRWTFGFDAVHRIFCSYCCRPPTRTDCPWLMTRRCEQKTAVRLVTSGTCTQPTSDATCSRFAELAQVFPLTGSLSPQLLAQLMRSRP